MKLTIGKLNDTWNYTVNLNNKNYYLRGVIDGETVEANIQKNGLSILKIINASSNRDKVKCPYQEVCGGCQGLHMKYEYQLALKEQMVERLFKDNKLIPSNFKVSHIISGIDNHYRNKSQIVFGYNSRKVVSGFYEELSHKIVNVNDCLMQDELITDAQKKIVDLIMKFHYTIYDEATNKGLIKHVLIKSTNLSEVMIVIVTNEDVLPGSNNFVKAIISQMKNVKSIIQNINNKKTTHVLGDKSKVLFGKDYISDELLGFKFIISSKSFYQINKYTTPLLYKEIVNLVKNKSYASALDAYSGTSTIGIIVSPYVKKVTCVELEKEAVNNAKENVKVNKTNNVRVFQGDATQFINNMERSHESVDLVLMDPPRSGSTQEFMKALKKLKPKEIIYISCDPHTQVEDLKILINDYTISKIQPVDMFPNTFHVETVVLLTRKNSK